MLNSGDVFAPSAETSMLCWSQRVSHKPDRPQPLPLHLPWAWPIWAPSCQPQHIDCRCLARDQVLLTKKGKEAAAGGERDASAMEMLNMPENKRRY